MRAASRWPRSLAVGSLSLVTLFGCASIIGLDDYTVAGQAGQAGATGKAGATNADAGTPGEAGDTSQGGGPITGEGGAAGEPTTVPPIVGCDGVTAFEPTEDIVTSCIVRAGCNPNFNPVRNISTCVTFNTQQALPGESCTLHATTCAEYEECEHIGVAKDDLCGAGAQVTRCEGNIAVNCDNYSTNQFSDCDALGGTCAVYDFKGTNYADCQLDVAPDTNCAGETDDTKYFCHTTGNQDYRYFCWDGNAYGSSCSALAYCDGDQTKGDSSCYYDLPTCGTDSVTCKNNIASVCSSGSLFKYDCGSVGLTCGVTAGTEYCFAPGCKAADVDTKCTESCSDDGTQLNFCYGGAPYTVDCANYGFTHCESDKDDNDVPFAACRL